MTHGWIEQNCPSCKKNTSVLISAKMCWPCMEDERIKEVQKQSLLSLVQSGRELIKTSFQVSSTVHMVRQEDLIRFSISLAAFKDIK